MCSEVLSQSAIKASELNIILRSSLLKTVTLPTKEYESRYIRLNLGSMIKTVKHIKVRDVFNHSIHANNSELKREKNRMVTCKSIIDMLIMLS